MNQQFHRSQQLALSYRAGVVLVLLSLPFWTGCSNNEEEAAEGFPIPYLWPHQIMTKDKFVPNTWLGLSISDRFDDTVTKRIIYYSTEDSNILLFERVEDEGECLTEMLVRFPHHVLPAGRWLERGEMRSAAVEKRENDKKFIPTVPVSFNFKRQDADDLKILDQEFRDSALLKSGSTPIHLRNAIETDLRSYVTALQDSYEVRIKADFSTFRLDFKVNLQNFSEKFTSLTEVCRDETLDISESDDENNLVQKEID